MRRRVRPCECRALTPEPRSGGPLRPSVDRVGSGNHADALGPLQPDPVVREKLFVLLDLLRHDLAELEDLLVPARRDIERQTADPHGVVGEPRAAHLLEQIENQLALAERVEEHRHRADVHCVRADPQAVARDSLQLAQNRPHVPRAPRHFDRHQLLDGLAVADIVRGRCHVVHPIGEQDDLRPVAILAQLLDAAVQVADHDVAVDDVLAVQPQDDAQHAVRARMLRPHVEHQLIGVEHRATLNHRRFHDSSIRTKARSPRRSRTALRDFVSFVVHSMSASSRVWRNFSQSIGFSINSSPGPSSG